MNQDNLDREAWIENWKSIGPILAAQQSVELRQLSARQRQQQIANLLDLGYQFRRPRIDQGLVHMQRTFAEIFGK